MSDIRSETEILLARAKTNDESAIAQLLRLHRPKVRRMIAVRLDRRLATRVDPSDVVQEALIDAVRRLPQYLGERPVAFYPWLRDIAMNRLIDVHRQHLVTKKRNVQREEAMYERRHLPDESQMELAGRLIDPGSSPSRRMEKKEQQLELNAALEDLNPDDREVLVLKYLEELSAPEIAEILCVSERTVWRRHTRAIEQLSDVLTDDEGEGSKS
jgi:RNA polymerase sigma-70 factor (ECF subfamily)